jgi:hypothetical protein
MERKNWIVRCYDKKDVLIDSFKIKDRTEHEADNEAQALMPRETEDWTMMPEDWTPENEARN